MPATEDAVIFLSHRGPVEYDRQEGAERTTGRGGGGLVTALSGLAGRLDDAVWVCAAMTDEDRAVAGEHGGKAFDAPELVRERCPDVFLHHFVHIPWPQPDAWRILPKPMREAAGSSPTSTSSTARRTGSPSTSASRTTWTQRWPPTSCSTS